MKRTAHWQRQRPSPHINKKNIKNRICAAALPAHAQWSYSCPFDLWRVRLVVRTQPSQGWCTGSTPVRAADFLALHPNKQRTQCILFCVTEIIRMNCLVRFPALISFFLLCCGLTSCYRDGITRQVAARVLSLRGPVAFGIDEQSDFRPVTPESRIHDCDIVRTSTGAFLNLALIPATLAQMSSNSEIKVEELRISKDGNQTSDGMRGRSARIRLSGGKITVLFRQRGKSVSQFTINAPQAAITADSDCLFRIQSDGTTTRLTCVRGKVRASRRAQPPVEIGAGYSQQWPSVRPEPIAAADDAAAQIDIVDSLEIGNQLRELQSGWQDRRSF